MKYIKLVENVRVLTINGFYGIISLKRGDINMNYPECGGKASNEVPPLKRTIVVGN